MSFIKLRKRLFFISVPLSVIYYIITSLRNLLYDKKIFNSEEFDIPVISVGNITVGGTGKTPHIEYLVHLLKNEFTIAVLSRGYKRETKSFILATNESTINEIGDEPKQIKNKYPEIHVAVDKKRVNGIKILKGKIHDLNVVLLDDAFQHRAVIPGISILLIDYNRPVFKDFILPFGDLRESIRNVERASIVIVTKTPGSIKPIEKKIWMKNLSLMPFQKLYFTTFEYGTIHPVFPKTTKEIAIDEIKKQEYSVLLVTGIANPGIINEWIKKYSKAIKIMNYSDHHKFTDEDILKIEMNYKRLNGEKKIILTTEKDAVRLREMKNINDTLRGSLYFVPVNVRFLDGDQKDFDKGIINYVKYKRKIGQLI